MDSGSGTTVKVNSIVDVAEAPIVVEFTEGGDEVVVFRGKPVPVALKDDETDEESFEVADERMLEA